MNNNESANTTTCQLTDSVILIQSSITIVTLFSQLRNNVCKRSIRYKHIPPQYEPSAHHVSLGF